MNLVTYLNINAGGQGSGPTAPCPQCGPHHEHYQDQDSRRHIGFSDWMKEHEQRIANVADTPAYDRLIQNQHKAEFVPRARVKERQAILLQDIKQKEFPQTNWNNLTPDQSKRIADLYNMRRTMYGLLPTTPEQDELIDKMMERRHAQPIPEDEPDYETVTPKYLQEAVSPGVRIAQYQNQLPTTVKTTGKSWTSRPHNDKGDFKQEATVDAPHEGRKTFVLTHTGTSGGTTAFVNQFERSRGAKNNHVIIHETDFDNYGNRWRTRSREFTAPKSAFKHIENRYGVKL